MAPNTTKKTTTAKATPSTATKKVTALEKKVDDLEKKIASLSKSLDALSNATGNSPPEKAQARLDACVSALCSNDFAKGRLQAVSAKVRSKV